MDLLRWTFALIGHIGVWCFIFNWTHSTALPRIFRKRTEKGIVFAVGAPILFFLASILWKQDTAFSTHSENAIPKYFLYACIALGIFFFAQWLYRKFTAGLPKAIVSTKSVHLDLKQELGDEILKPGVARAIGRLPFNECLQLALNHMTIRLDVCPKLDGFKICQLSDLHFTGQIGVEYFERVVAEANKLEPDLIVITGDLVDERECLPWLESTLGKLRAKHGVYYVFGNHDLRVKDETGFRQQLAGLGLIQASGKWHEIQVGDAIIHLTGTELPWYPDVKNLGHEPARKPDLKILLSHSPDQLEWARPFKFDLMFAGHTHGGQVAFPIIGALVAPSKYGVRYAAGTFQIDDMIMHVSRGISGDEPIRLCCVPEVGLFTVQSSRKSKSKSDNAETGSEENVEVTRRQPQGSIINNGITDTGTTGTVEGVQV